MTYLHGFYMSQLFRLKIKKRQPLEKSVQVGIENNSILISLENGEKSKKNIDIKY